MAEEAFAALRPACWPLPSGPYTAGQVWRGAHCTEGKGAWRRGREARRGPRPMEVGGGARGLEGWTAGPPGTWSPPRAPEEPPAWPY